MAPRQAKSETVDGNKEEAKAVAGKFGVFPVGVNIEENDIKGTGLSMISGPAPGGSVMDTTKEAGGRSFSIRTEPEPGAPEPDAETEAVHAW